MSDFWSSSGNKFEIIMTKEQEIEDAGFVSAIWILSCNDPIPTMTYTYIYQRLALNKERAKELIGSHKELFSTSISKNWRDAWKKRMENGDSLPSRIASEKDPVKKKKAIEDVVNEDLFRSQFRLSCSATVSPIEITKWGLEHIEKARKSKNEVKEEKQRWLKDFIIPIITILLSAIISLGSVYLINSSNTENKKIDERMRTEDIKFQKEKFDKETQLKEKEIQMKEKEIEMLKEKSNIK